MGQGAVRSAAELAAWIISASSLEQAQLCPLPSRNRRAQLGAVRHRPSAVTVVGAQQFLNGLNADGAVEVRSGHGRIDPSHLPPAHGLDHRGLDQGGGVTVKPELVPTIVSDAVEIVHLPADAQGRGEESGRGP
jgi:hypothetical protein